MESIEGMNSGVTVIAAEAPSSYHVAPRTENSTQAEGTPPVGLSPVTVLGKKKRGRPRKYGPDGAVAGTFSPVPISVSAPPRPATGEFLGSKRGKGRPAGLDNNPSPRIGMQNLGEWASFSSGGNFTPHVIEVNAGEDVTMKIIALSQQGPRAICIISAVGGISNVTLRQPDSSGGTLTYEGRFEILSLSGSFTPTVVGGSRSSRTGGMSIAFASPDGRIVGGLLAGLLIAASPIQVIVGSFLPSNLHEPKPKKQKPELKSTTAVTGSTAVPRTSNVDQNSFNAQDQNNTAAEKPNTASSSPFQTNSWATLPIVQDLGKSTDVNLPFQGE